MTPAATGALAGLAVAWAPISPAQSNVSWADLASFLLAGLVMGITIRLWSGVATATARHLTLTPRVRAAQLLLGAILQNAIPLILVTFSLWCWETQASVTLLVLGLVILAAVCVSAPARIRQAVRQGRRLRAAASGAAVVNPSAQRDHGRHRA